MISEPDCTIDHGGTAAAAQPDGARCVDAQKMTEALQLLCQAYDLAPHSAVVLNMLAHHCLLRGDYDKVCTPTTVFCTFCPLL